MRNPPPSRNGDGNNPTNSSGEDKEIRDVASLGGAFLNQYRADRAEEKENKRIEHIWIKRGAEAAICYTVITAIIMIFSIRQTMIARDTERRQLRAYIQVMPDRPAMLDIIAGRQPIGPYTVRNVGQTPAYEETERAILVYARYPLLPNTRFVYLSAPGELPAGKITLGSSFSRDTGSIAELADPISANQIAALARSGGAARLIVAGTINYRDIFGDRHYTNFCWSAWGDGPTIDTVAWCDQHNDAN